MPPTFAYGMGLLLYMSVTGPLIVLCVVLEMFEKTRTLGTKLRTCALVSFPSMLAHQVLAFPITIVIILIAGLVMSGGGLSLEAFVAVPLLFLSIIWFGTASAYGIYFGYRFTWEFLGGASVKDAVHLHFAGKLIWRFFKDRLEKLDRDSLIRR